MGAPLRIRPMWGQTDVAADAYPTWTPTATPRLPDFTVDHCRCASFDSICNERSTKRQWLPKEWIHLHTPISYAASSMSDDGEFSNKI